jgi:hypothetical protein
LPKTAQPRGFSTSSSEARHAAKAVVWPDAWASYLSLKVDGKEFSITNREYIATVMRDKSDEVVIKKAAQMGFTVAAILKALHAVSEKRWHTLYLMPFKAGAISFVQQRIDQTIDSSPQLLSHFNKVDNRLHKQTKDGIALYVRGTNVVTDLREIPVDFEIWDERDKFVEDNLTEALARMDGSKIRKLIQLSTPTAPGHGVDSDENWYSTDQKLWFIPCPHCGKFQNLNFDENIKLGDNADDSCIECTYCKKALTDDDRWNANSEGRWQAQFLDARKSGYHISQLNSATKDFRTFIIPFFEGQKSASKLRGFYNNQLGEPYAGSDDKFTPEILDDCIVPGHRLKTIPTGPIYGGIDIGSVLHAKFSYMGRGEKKVMYDYKIFNTWDDLEKYIDTLHNFNIVIDAHPEKHKAAELAKRYPGRIWLGFERDAPNQPEVAVFHTPKKGEAGTVTIDRTMALDQLIQDHQKGDYVYPADARLLGENLPKRNYNGFYAHHFEMARMEIEDSNGRIVARWKKTRNPDHGTPCRSYSSRLLSSKSQR